MNNALGVTILVGWMLIVVGTLIVGLVRLERPVKAERRPGGWLCLLAVVGLLLWLYVMPLWLIPRGVA